MILSWRNKKTRAFAEGVFVPSFQGFAAQASKRLAILDAAAGLEDLQRLRSNRFESLSGDRVGQFSIRINSQWRICFVWNKDESGPTDVEIVDCH
jgi:proteic killer suppression protein